jgi:beta-N-acetylhexosaminidase
VPEDLRALLREWTPAGFIVFARNVEEPAQVRELNRELASLVPDAMPPLLTVDQEGGRVQRVRDGATSWPPLRWVGNCADAAITADHARALADEVYALGFNLNWAPVADVNSNPGNPVIGDRSFGTDPGRVADQVALWIREAQARGVMACAKHFPGHGDTSQDSHHHLPVVEKELPALLEVERPPFEAAVRAGVAAIMTAHVVFPDLEEGYPATMSPPIVKGWLRDQLGYQGLVVSDDMEMKAVRGRFDLEEQLERACRATLDLFLVCHTPSLQQDCFEHLVRLQEVDPAQDQLAEDSEARLVAARERFLLGRPPMPPLEVLDSQAHRDLALRIRARGEGLS